MGNRWLWSSFDPPTPHRFFGLKLIKISRPVNPLSQFAIQKFSTFLRAGIGSAVDNCDPTGRKDTALGTETMTFNNISNQVQVLNSPSPPYIPGDNGTVHWHGRNVLHCNSHNVLWVRFQNNMQCADDINGDTQKWIFCKQCAVIDDYGGEFENDVKAEDDDGNLQSRW